MNTGSSGKDGHAAFTSDVYDETGDPEFKINLVINEGAKIAVFHNKPFRTKIAWLEYDLDEDRLEFVLGDGKIRNFGGKMPSEYQKAMQNAHQILIVQMNEETGEPIGGNYYPLILHKKG